MTLVTTNESKDSLKNMKNCGIKSEILLDQQPITDNYVKKYMKIKFNSDNNLPLKKALYSHKMRLVLRFVFHEGKKYYPLVLLHKYLYELSRFEYDRN